MKDKRHQEKVGDKNTRCLRIVAIHHVSTPNADLRLACAIDLLLRPVAGSRKEAPMLKEKEPAQDSRPEKVAGGSDEI